MKDERKQSKKHHESTIGKIIYGFLLFMPLFAIGTTCLISTFNMASKEETEIHYKYATNEVNSANDLVIGNVYKFDLNSFFNESLSNYVELYDINSFIVYNSNDVNVHEIYNISDYYLYIIQEEDFISVVNDYFGMPLIEMSYEQSKDFDLYITYSINENNIYNINNDYWTYLSICPHEHIPIDYVETHNVSAQDVFYDSVDKVQQSPLFNWTTNTGIYTDLNNTCSSLGITTTFVPLLLAYWLIISVMYFLYDIVLIILNILHRKIHELQESI